MKLSKYTKRKWINALRSGKFKQGEVGRLKDDKGGYCCLGVLCEISKKFKPNKYNIFPKLTEYPNKRDYLPIIQKVTLSSLNDGNAYHIGPISVGGIDDISVSDFEGQRFTFDEIADLIQISEEI